MTWSPLACGIVSGKYDSGIPPYSRASLKVKEWPGQGRGRAFRRAEALAQVTLALGGVSRARLRGGSRLSHPQPLLA